QHSTMTPARVTARTSAPLNLQRLRSIEDLPLALRFSPSVGPNDFGDSRPTTGGSRRSSGPLGFPWPEGPRRKRAWRRPITKPRPGGACVFGCKPRAAPHFQPPDPRGRGPGVVRGGGRPTGGVFFAIGISLAPPHQPRPSSAVLPQLLASSRHLA